METKSIAANKSRVWIPKASFGNQFRSRAAGNRFRLGRESSAQLIRPSAFGGIIPVGHETTSFSYSPRIWVAHENVSLSCSTYKFQCTVPHIAGQAVFEIWVSRKKNWRELRFQRSPRSYGLITRLRKQQGFTLQCSITQRLKPLPGTGKQRQRLPEDKKDQ